MKRILLTIILFVLYFCTFTGCTTVYSPNPITSLILPSATRGDSFCKNRPRVASGPPCKNFSLMVASTVFCLLASVFCLLTSVAK
jgi:hypothetical protein